MDKKVWMASAFSEEKKRRNFSSLRLQNSTVDFCGWRKKIIQGACVLHLNLELSLPGPTADVKVGSGAGGSGCGCGGGGVVSRFALGATSNLCFRLSPSFGVDVISTGETPALPPTALRAPEPSEEPRGDMPGLAPPPATAPAPAAAAAAAADSALSAAAASGVLLRKDAGLPLPFCRCCCCCWLGVVCGCGGVSLGSAGEEA